MNSGPKSTTQTQTSAPPAYVQPFLQQSAQEAQRLYGQGPQQYFPGNTVTPFSDQTQQALDLTQQRAVNGSPVVDAAQGYAQRTLNDAPTSQFGSAQNPYASAPNPYGGATNPYLDATFNKSADQVQNRIQSGFAGAGRNIEAGRPLAAQELGDLANTIYGGAYNDERNRQLQYQQQLTGIGAQGYEAERARMAADLGQQRGIQSGVAQLAPGLAQADYADLSALGGVGSQYEDLASRNIADQVSRYDYNQAAPGVSLDQYIARLNNQPGGSSSSNVPYFQNRAAGGLGGAALGYSLLNGSPWGAAAGGLLGAFG